MHRLEYKEQLRRLLRHINCTHFLVDSKFSQGQPIILQFFTFFSIMFFSKAAAVSVFISIVSAETCAKQYYQCGGKNWNGTTCCEAGSYCKVQNDYYSQCVAVEVGSSGTYWNASVTSNEIQYTTTDIYESSDSPDVSSESSTSSDAAVAIESSTDSVSGAIETSSSAYTPKYSHSHSAHHTTTQAVVVASSVSDESAGYTNVNISVLTTSATAPEYNYTTTGGEASNSTETALSSNIDATSDATPTSTFVSVVGISSVAGSTDVAAEISSSTSSPAFESSVVTSSSVASSLSAAATSVSSSAADTPAAVSTSSASPSTSSSAVSAASSSAASSDNELVFTPISGGFSGTGVTTRYWDCCKPSCAWSGKADVSSPVAACSADGVTIAGVNDQSGCNGGDAYMCSNQQPFAINSTLAYGFAAASMIGGSESSMCCSCVLLTFNDGPAAGKQMVTQITNTGSDLSSNHFDIAVPGGGVGIYNGCTSQWKAGTDGWGERYGGVSSESACSELPTQLQSGCDWRWDFLEGSDNPSVSFFEIECPAEITAITGCKRN